MSTKYISQPKHTGPQMVKKRNREIMQLTIFSKDTFRFTDLQLNIHPMNSGFLLIENGKRVKKIKINPGHATDKVCTCSSRF